MKVLQLVRSLDIGGLESVVINLVNGLSKQGVDCALGCLVGRGAQFDRAHACDTWIGDVSANGHFRTIASLCRFIKRAGIDVIHSHNPQPHAYGVLASLLTGVPLVHTKHGRNYVDDPAWVRRSRLMSRFTKRIIAVSDNVARVATEVEKVPGEKVDVIHNGVDVSRCSMLDAQCSSEMRKKLGVAEGALVIGSVGRFSPEKNYPLLIRAFARLASEPQHLSAVALAKEELNNSTTQQLTLLLVGDGPDRGRIEAEVEKCGVADRVILPGMQNDVLPWLQCMDVFCLSSNTEGMSMTLLEACGHGIPAVVTDVGGNAEVVEHAVTGLVVPPGDEDALVTALKSMIENTDRQGMGTKGRQRIEASFSLDATLSAYERVYRSLV